MPVDNKGNFRLHSGAVNMHNANPPIASKKGDVSGKERPDPGKQEGEDKGHVELHVGPHEQAPDAKFHTIHHDAAGGEPEVKGHETLHEAHHATNEHMGGSSSDLHECTEPDADDLSAAGADEY